MFDEVEYITHGLSGALGQHWDGDFVPLWQCIRATHQETGGKFAFIVAGVNPSSVVRSHFGVTSNPIFQLAAPLFLEPLSVEAVRQMVRSIGRYAGLRFDEDVYQHLQETYGGHPYLIRVTCSEIWRVSDTKNPEHVTTVSVDAFIRRRREIKARLSQPIKDILLSLVWWYPEEYDLLRIFAEGSDGAGFVSEYMQTEPEAIIQFARYGILREGGGSFAIADLQEFLNEHGETYKREISPFVRGDMPPELLPEVPDLGLLGQLFEKRTEVELKLRKAIIYYLNVKYTFDPAQISQALMKGLRVRSDRKQPQALFIGRSPQDVINELYTSDLRSIIVANWDIFSPLFDGKKTWFEMNMETMNKARRVDAHAKPIDASEALDFNNSYSWLLNRLAKIP